MIAITVGDANGVGPELALKAWTEGLFAPDTVVIGDICALERAREALSLDVPLRLTSAEALQPAADVLSVISPGLLQPQEIEPGTLSRACGAAAVSYVEIATRLALAGHIAAMVTLPINKEAVGRSRPGFSGHTEFIAELCGAAGTTMMLASERMIVTHVSTHVPLRVAIERAQRERILEVIELTDTAVRRLRPTARIAVAGLNPHAGEHGAFGNEDSEQIEPAVREARARGIDAYGPIAADTVFYHVLETGRYDAVVCMYHDQGHIPMKTIDFDGGVNVTLGLPIVRTSVDHGTAFDIAYKGVARTRSLHAAYRMARLLASADKTDAPRRLDGSGAGSGMGGS